MSDKLWIMIGDKKAKERLREMSSSAVEEDVDEAAVAPSTPKSTNGMLTTRASQSRVQLSSQRGR